MQPPGACGEVGVHARGASRRKAEGLQHRDEAVREEDAEVRRLEALDCVRRLEGF